jgi:hypothetical protein
MLDLGGFLSAEGSIQSASLEWSAICQNAIEMFRGCDRFTSDDPAVLSALAGWLSDFILHYYWPSSYIQSTPLVLLS